jgi:hypothetical protein
MIICLSCLVRQCDGMDIKRPEGMTEEEWASVQALSPEMRATALSLWQSMQNLPAPSRNNPHPLAFSHPVQLPLWPEPQRASPNAFLRSAVFPAIQGKTRRYMKKEIIAAQNGYEINFTGQMLDQSDFDIWMQAAHIARSSPLGTECHFTGRGFLKSIGRSGGGKDIEWLKGSLARLQTSMLEIKIGPKWLRLNLLVRSSGDDETTDFILKFDPILIKLFDLDNWTALRWEERRKLKGKPLALWLHGYYSSHAAPYPIKVETLMKLSGSKGPLRNFRIRLETAFKELEVWAEIKATFDGDLVTVETNPSPTQLRHLNKSQKRRKVSPA